MHSFSPKTSGEDITICKWEDNLKRDITEIGCSDIDWIHLAQGTTLCRNSVNAVINVRVLRMSHTRDRPQCLQVEDIFLSVK
jgi:hypothetical protein